jgi:hypothetical protein
MEQNWKKFDGAAGQKKNEAIQIWRRPRRCAADSAPAINFWPFKAALINENATLLSLYSVCHFSFSLTLIPLWVPLANFSLPSSLPLSFSFWPSLVCLL